MTIVSANAFTQAIKRDWKSNRSARLNSVISSLDSYHKNSNLRNLESLHKAVNLWAKQDPKEFLNRNFISNNAVYMLFAEVNAEFYAKGLGPYEFVPQPKGLVFIPFGWQGAEEFRVKSEQWNSSESKNTVKGIGGFKTRQYQIVTWTHNEIKPSIRDFRKTNSEIFIRGHGSPGATHISTRNNILNKSVTDAVSVIDVCKRLISSGLDKSYAGNINFYTCYSGVDALPADIKYKHNKQKQTIARGGKVRDELLVGSKSIARIGADYMRSNGYSKARYFGYLGPLISLYSKPDFDSQTESQPIDKREIDEFMHRYVDISPQGYKVEYTGSGGGTIIPNKSISKKYRARVGKREV